MLCRNCQSRKPNRPRGLCWSCYYKPGVRDKFPSTSKYARRGISDFNGKHRSPPTYTDAMPGTPEKVAVLAERAKMGVSLWHPDDATMQPGSRRLMREAG